MRVKVHLSSIIRIKMLSHGVMVPSRRWVLQEREHHQVPFFLAPPIFK